MSDQQVDTQTFLSRRQACRGPDEVAVVAAMLNSLRLMIFIHQLSCIVLYK